MADLGLVETEEERLLRLQRERGSQLDLNPQGPLSERPVDTSGPPSEIPGLARTPGGVAPSFDNLFGNFQTGQLPVGSGLEEGQVSPKALAAAGGPRAVLEAQRTSMGVGTALDFTQALLGRTTGTQSAEQAEDPEFGLAALNPLQRIFLGIGDIVALSEGKMMPSMQLKMQGRNALTLEDQNNRQAMTTGFKLMKDTIDLISGSNLSREDRLGLGATQVPMWEATLPGFGAIGLAILNAPTEADAWHALMSDENFWKGTAAERESNYITAVGFVDQKRAGELLKNTFKKDGSYSQSLNAIGPSVFEQKLPAMIESARAMGGKMAEFANVLANGGEFTPEEFTNWVQGLAVNVQLEPAFLEQFNLNTEDYLSVTGLGGVRTAKYEAARQEKERDGEYTSLTTLVSTDGYARTVTGPHQGKVIRNLVAAEPTGWVEVAMTHEALGLGGDSTKGGIFDAPSSAVVTDIQKELLELQQNSDELIGIQEGFNANLQTYGAKFKNWRLRIQQGFGGELSEEDTAFRTEFVANQTRTLTSLSATLNRLSGAAVSPQEFERIQGTRPSTEDDPGTFEIKMNTAIALNQFAHARMNVFRLIGENRIGEAFNLRREDIRSFIQNMLIHEDEKQRNSPQGRTEDEISFAVLDHVAKEMGVRPEDLDGIVNGGPGVTLKGEPLRDPGGGAPR